MDFKKLLPTPYKINGWLSLTWKITSEFSLASFCLLN